MTTLNGRTAVAIIGSVNIGIDLRMKVMRLSNEDMIVDVALDLACARDLVSA